MMELDAGYQDVLSNLGGLQKLEQLYLHYNRLSGTVPSLRGMAPSLRFIHIGGNVASRNCADPCGGLSGGLSGLPLLTGRGCPRAKLR